MEREGESGHPNTSPPLYYSVFPTVNSPDFTATEQVQNWEQIMLMESVIKFWLCIYTSGRDRLEGHGPSPAWVELLREQWFKNHLQLFMARVPCCICSTSEEETQNKNKAAEFILDPSSLLCSEEVRAGSFSQLGCAVFTATEQHYGFSPWDSGHNLMLVRLKDWPAAFTG